MATSPGTVRDVEQEPQSSDEFIHHDHIGHGSTPAAWALSGTIIVAGVMMGVGMIAQWWIMVWIGVALVPVALVLGVVLKRAGYGVEMDSDSVLKRGADPRAHSGPASPDNTQGGEEKREPQAGTN